MVSRAGKVYEEIRTDHGARRSIRRSTYPSTLNVPPPDKWRSAIDAARAKEQG